MKQKQQDTDNTIRPGFLMTLACAVAVIAGVLCMLKYKPSTTSSVEGATAPPVSVAATRPAVQQRVAARAAWDRQPPPAIDVTPNAAPENGAKKTVFRRFASAAPAAQVVEPNGTETADSGTPAAEVADGARAALPDPAGGIASRQSDSAQGIPATPLPGTRGAKNPDSKALTANQVAGGAQTALSNPTASVNSRRSDPAQGNPAAEMSGSQGSHTTAAGNAAAALRLESDRVRRAVVAEMRAVRRAEMLNPNQDAGTGTQP